MATIRFIFTCIPNPTPGPQPRLTVMVSPRLGGAPKGTTLSGWTDLAPGWPALLRNAAIVVQLDGRAVPATLADPQRLDDSLWTALFPPAMDVIPFQFKPDARPIRSHPAGDVADHIHDIYLKTAVTSPDDPPALIGPGGTPTPITDFLGELVTTVDHLHGSNGDVGLPWTTSETEHQWPTRPDGSFAPQRAFYLANRFYMRRPPGTTPPLEAPAPEKLIPDFHQRVSLLGDHPALLRGTGLAFDVLLPAGSPAAQGVVSISIAWRGGASTADVSPTTHYTVAGGRFLPQPMPGMIELDAGYLRLDTVVNGKAVYRLLHLDTDGAAHQSVAFASAIAGQVGDTTRPPIERTTLPTLRSAGLTLTRTNRDKWLQVFRTHGEDLDGKLATNQPVELYAEDLMRGYRLDVELDGDGHFRSLCGRYGAITGIPNHADIPVGAEESYIKAASAASADGVDPAIAELYLHEAIAGWDGWSLAVRRPGGAVKFDGTTETVVPGDGGNDPIKHPTVFTPKYQPGPEPLPRLRYGRSYRLRARAVDLAGGGIPAGDPGAIHTTPSVTYGRYEPVLPPALVLRKPIGEAEALERMVVHSPGGAPGPIVDMPIYRPEINERHVLPPKTTLATAEAHGRMDGAFTPGAARDHWYHVARKEKGTLLDTRRVNLATGADDDVANIVLVDPPSSLKTRPVTFPAKGELVETGQYVTHTGDEVLIPYLPDPLAAGLVLQDVAPAADSSGPTIINVGYQSNPVAWAGGALDDWPDKKSLRIVLRAGQGTQIVRQAADSDARTIVFDVPPGRSLTLRYSSWPTAQLAHLALWNELQASPAWLALSSTERAMLASAIQNGTHWMFTPSRDLTLVHAVQRPATPPSFDRYWLARDVGDTSVRFSDVDTPGGALLTHSWSTSHVDVRATWKEWIDDPDAPGGVRVEPRVADAFRVAITAGQDRTHLVASTRAVQRVPGANRLGIVEPGAQQPPAQGTRPVHDIGDTKRHSITYTPVGTTRYQEYFPAALIADHANLELAGVAKIEDVPNTATPPPPAVLYAVPTFGWIDAPSGRTRVGRGVRIYLDRPWFQSGEGERLAVILPMQGVPPTAPAQQHVTRWGTDPAWSGPGGAPPPIVSAIVLPTDTITYLAGTPDAYAAPRALTDAAALPIGDAKYPVIGYLPEWNAERKLWYVDVELDTGATYWPFISFALARWQPNSVTGVAMSNAVRCHFVQLAPDRAATVSRVGSSVTVDVTGVTAGNAIEAYYDEPGPWLKLKPKRWIHDESLAAAHRVFARIERLDPSLDPKDSANDLRWTIAVNPVELKAVSIDAATMEVRWSIGMTVPTTSGAFRVVITETELYPSETGSTVYVASGSMRGRERVVYIDSLPI